MNNEPENNPLLHDALKAYGLRNDIGRLHKEMMGELSEKKIHRPVRFLSISLRIAASLLLMIFGVAAYIYISTTSQQLFDRKFVPYEVSVQRSGDSTANGVIFQKFGEAQQYMIQNNPQEAIVSLEELINDNRRRGTVVLTDDSEYYLGLAYLQANEPTKAYQLFNKINRQRDHLYHKQISDWYLFRLRMLAWKSK